jgi:regulator of protease activity HflC (stomatin/prohibitin superfamily)
MFGYRFVVITEGHTGLFYRDGRFIQTLAPGRYAVRQWPWLREEIRTLDVRRTQLPINGQEMLTADSLSLRLNLTASYRIVDASRAVHSVECFQSALYNALQLLLREEVQARPLDVLLAERQALSAVLRERGRPEAATLGLELLAVGVKDIILPGDLKRMLSRELEAQRLGRAALVAAREEVAAMRARANTAQLMESHPVLLRLREIEALAELGSSGAATLVPIPLDLLTRRDR